MEKHNIDPQQMKGYLNKERAKYLFVIGFILMLFLGFVILKGKELNYSGVEWEGTLLSFIIIFFFVISIALWQVYLIRILAENLTIQIDEISISRIIDIKNEDRFNFLEKFFFQWARNKASSVDSNFNCRILFDEIKSIDYRNGKLIIKSIKYNSVSGKDFIKIPKEILNFEKIELLVKSKSRFK